MRLSLARSKRRFLSDRTGALAVEFALITPVFLLFVFIIIDLGIELATQMALDNAVNYAARQIQIGSITSGGASTFKTVVCNRASALIPSCTSSIQVYVTSGSSFSGLTPATVSAGTLSPSTFSPGSAGSDVLVQVAYSRSFLFGMLSKTSGFSQTTLLSTVAVANEPYS